MSQKGTISTYESGVDLVVEWKIEHFFTLSEIDATWYESPDFSFGNERWNLRIYTNGFSVRDSSGHVDLDLCKYDSDRSIRQSFSISLKSIRGEKYNEQQCTKDFDDAYYFHRLKRFIPRSELSRRRSELVPEDNLTVICTMKSSTSAGSDSDSESESPERSSDSDSDECCHKCSNCLDIVKNQKKLLEELESQKKRSEGEACASVSFASPYEKKVLHDFKELFLQKEDCDVIIKVKGSEIRAHRLVLKVRSPVFASTFRHDMKESATGVVEIEDCDSSPFSDFLYFLYCGDVGMISRENVFSLFRLADKYQVLDLKAKCLDFIKKNMIVDTFCETITLALQHSETELVSLATDFFVKNAEEILLTVKWQTFAAENPTQSNELVIKFVRSVKH